MAIIYALFTQSVDPHHIGRDGWWIAPLRRGIVVKKFSVTDNISWPRTWKINRSTERNERILQTYMKLSGPLLARLRLFIIPFISMTSVMLAEIWTPENIRPLTMAKRLDALTLALPEEPIKICRDAKWSCENLEKEILRVSAEFSTCIRTGLPIPAKTCRWHMWTRRLIHKYRPISRA